MAKSADQDQLASSEVNCQLNWIYTVCIYTVGKSRSYLGAAGPDLYTCIFSSKVATHLATLSVIFCGYSSINFSDNVTTPSRAENKYRYKRRNESIFQKLTKMQVTILDLKPQFYTVVTIEVLTLTMPRKPASENIVCLCHLLNILANFSNLFLHTGKQCGP